MEIFKYIDCEESPHNNRLNKLFFLCTLYLCGEMFLHLQVILENVKLSVICLTNIV